MIKKIMNWEVCGEKRPWLTSLTIPHFGLGDWWKILKISVRATGLQTAIKPRRPEYETEVISTDGHTSFFVVLTERVVTTLRSAISTLIDSKTISDSIHFYKTLQHDARQPVWALNRSKPSDSWRSWEANTSRTEQNKITANGWNSYCCCARISCTSINYSYSRTEVPFHKRSKPETWNFKSQFPVKCGGRGRMFRPSADFMQFLFIEPSTFWQPFFFCPGRTLYAEINLTIVWQFPIWNCNLWLDIFFTFAWAS
jgi:hypothetical protein